LLSGGNVSGQTILKKYEYRKLSGKNIYVSTVSANGARLLLVLRMARDAKPVLRKEKHGDKRPNANFWEQACAEPVGNIHIWKR